LTSHIVKPKQFFLPFLFLLIHNISAQDLIWPTNASQLLTATFGEYRSDHFHAGIDIKTWGREGYPVYAVEDGSVVRVLVSPNGYGRAVYFQTQSGQTVVFGHLSQFNDQIEERIRKEQNRLGRYRVQMYFKGGELPFQKGEILAYSGSTGIGVPHLHFEIRDSLNRPVNPLNFNFPIVDTIAPEIQAVALSHLTAGSHVNGDFKPAILNVTKTGSNLYQIDEPFTAHGRLGVSVAAIDLANGATNPLAFYQVELWIDGTCIYQFQNDLFSYDETDLAELIYNTRLQSHSDLRFFNLFREKGNDLACYPPATPQIGVIRSGEDERREDGSIYLSEGTHSLWIVVCDYFGNQSDLFGDFTVSAMSVPEPQATMQWMQNGETQPAPSGLGGILSIRFLRDYLYFSVDASIQSMNHPSLIIESGLNQQQTVPLIQIEPDRFAGYFPLSLIQKDVLQISLTDGPYVDRVLDRITVPVFHIRPDEPVTVVSTDEQFSVYFSRQSVYESLWCTVEVSSNPITYHVLPDDVPLKKQVRISVHVPESSNNKIQLALYQIDEDGEYQFAGNQWDVDDLTARVSRLGRFTVLRDSVPPEILSIYPRNGATSRDQTPRIQIAFKDSLSGIGEEDDYIVHLNGKRLIMEYDPEEDVAFHQLISPIQPGEHVIEIALQDRCWNRVQHTSRFTIQ